MSELVKVEAADGIQVITINRPEARNAINLETAQAMAEVLQRMDADDAVRIGIVTGAGGTFSSGMDLKDFARSRQRPCSTWVVLPTMLSVRMISSTVQPIGGNFSAFNVWEPSRSPR